MKSRVGALKSGVNIPPSMNNFDQAPDTEERFVNGG